MKKELMRTERYIHIFDEAGKQLAHLPVNDSLILEGVPLLPPLDEGVFITPTHFDFEMETISKIVGNTWQYYESIKTTTNSQGQVVACGKYIY